MDVVASLKGFRISPRKARLVADQIRGKGVEDALNLLSLSAKKAGVPPYVVFSDATLQDMAKLCPRDDSELLQVKGVGEHKRGRYGAAFLALLAGEEPEAAAGRLPESGGREQPA